LVCGALVVLSTSQTAAAWPPGVGHAVRTVAVAGRRPPGVLMLDDKPELLRPIKPRSDVEQDRLEALSMFSAARILEEQERYAEALRLYQRALRYDPGAVTVARSIVPLAVRLDRHAEAVRYALKVVQMEDTDPLVLRRLGIYLTEKGEWGQAVAMYEKAVAGRKNAKPTAADVLLQMEMGRLYHLADQYDKAAKCFAQVLQAIAEPKKSGVDEEVKKVLLGEPGPTYQLIGECFLLANRPEDAVKAFEKANEVTPNKGLLNYNLARVEAKTGKPDQALTHVQVYFDAHLSSEGMAPYRLLAEVLEGQKKKGELIGRLEQMHAADPANLPLSYSLAENYREAGQLDKAERLLVDLLKATPTATGYRSLAAIYHKTKRAEPLLGVLGATVAKSGGLETLDEEGQAVVKDAEMTKALIEVAHKRLKADPKSLSYDERLAVALIALDGKQYEVASELFNLAIEARRDQAGEILLSWGLGLLMQERYAEAAKVFQRGLDQKAMPEDEAVLHYYLAGALEMDHQTEPALAAARKAAQLRDDSPRFLSRVGWVLYHANRNEEALKVYEDLLDKYDSDHSTAEVRQLMREARLVLSNLCVVARKLPQAEERLEEVLDEFPDDVSAMNDLGYLWADENKHLTRAHQMIQKAVEAEPDNAAYRDSLGWALYRLGRFAEAVEQLQKAAVVDADPVIFEHLGDACEKLGQPEKAKEAYRRAVTGFQKAHEAEKAKAIETKINQKLNR
jgi:tetratricopeptide (TPR) repeat protein